MDLSLALSHHTGEGLSRCFRVGRLRLCARCSGIWPALLLGMALQRLWLPPRGRVALAVELGLLWPALWDWARGQGRPDLGTNPGRLAVGLAFGLALSRAGVVARVWGYSSPEVAVPFLLCFSWLALAARHSAIGSAS